MKRLVSWITVFGLVFNIGIGYQATAEAAASKPFFSPELAVKAVARFMNESKTVSGIYKNFRPALSDSEYANIQKLFGKNWNDKLPACEAKGAELFCGGEVLATVNKDRTFTVKGQNFAAYKFGHMDEYLKDAKEKLGKFEARAALSLFPTAHAIGWGWLAGALGGVTLLSASMGSSWGMALFSGILAAGLVYAGAHLWEKFKNNTVQCDETDFVVRRKTTRGKLKLPGSERDTITSEQASQLAGEQIATCTPERAKRLQDGLRGGVVTRDPETGEYSSDGGSQ